MADPLVSIVIPCWNAEQYVLGAALSALGQTWPNVEVVVVDDGSTDGSVAALGRVRDRIRLVSTANGGAWRARNTGFEHSSGELIKFLDADDFLLPEAIARQVAAIGQLGEQAFTVGRLSALDEGTGIIRPHDLRSASVGKWNDPERMMIETPVTACALYRRAMVEAIGGFRELPMREDFDFFVRMVLAGFVPEEDCVPVYIYRDHPSPDRVSKRLSAEHYRAVAGMYRDYLEMLGGRVGQLDPGVARGLSKSAWITARDALRAGHAAEAKDIFGLARRFDPAGCVAGSRSYAAMVGLFGPELAEKIGQLRP
jgi:glycosyltransferase involved in cell wall biosynthesis